ncbi:hypothetical protein LSAT2_014381, partial [Lamellibrachia satsuma]
MRTQLMKLRPDMRAVPLTINRFTKPTLRLSPRPRPSTDVCRPCVSAFLVLAPSLIGRPNAEMGADHRLASRKHAGNAETPRTMGSRELVSLAMRLVRSRGTTKLSHGQATVSIVRIKVR